MKHSWLLPVTLIVTVGLLAPSGASAKVKKIDGYEVIDEAHGLSGKVTDLESGLGRLIDIGPLELGAAEEDHLVLHLYFRLVDTVPIEGKVHKIKFENLKLNEVSFTIPQVDSFEIPKNPPYEIEDPLIVKAAYGDIALGMLREMLEPNYTFQVTGRIYVYGKFKIDRRNKKAVIPVDVNVELSSDSLAESEYRDAVADQIFEILRADLLNNLETWREQVKNPEEGTPEGTPEGGTPEEETSPEGETSGDPATKGP